MLVLLGVGQEDAEEDALHLVQKCANLRVFDDIDGRMNRSLLDTGGEALVVSQFTLYADTRRGRRPGFADAAQPGLAKVLYARFVEGLRGLGVTVGTGVFGSRMRVEIHNDGPVTLMLESP